MKLQTYQREDRTYMSSEYYQYLYANELIVDGSAGGLVTGPSSSEGGIQMIHMNRDAEVFMAQKTEGWDFLINAFAHHDYAKEINVIARPSKPSDHFFLPYTIPLSVNTIVVTPREVNGVMMTPYIYFGTNFMGVLTKQVAKENLARLNEMNVAAWQTHYIEANPTPTVKETAFVARFSPKSDN